LDYILAHPSASAQISWEFWWWAKGHRWPTTRTLRTAARGWGRLLLVVHRGAASLLSIRISRCDINRTGFAVGRNDDAPGQSDFTVLRGGNVHGLAFTLFIQRMAACGAPAHRSSFPTNLTGHSQWA